MKKFLIFFVSIIMVFVSINLFACSTSKSGNKEYDEIMNNAISVLKEGWENVYTQRPIDNRENKIRIANSRIIEVKDTHEINEFQNIKSIIEFVVYSDYYGTQGKYYINAGIYDTVLVYKDGTMNFESQSLIKQYINMYIDTSLPFISSVVEFDSSYNQTINLNLN